MELTKSDNLPPDRASWSIPVFAAVLIMLWFVPDLLRAPPVFPFQTITQTQGSLLVAMLTPPAAGALLLLLFAVHRPVRPLQLASFFISAVAALILLLFGKPAFVFGPIGCVTSAAVLMGVAVFLRRRNDSLVVFFMLLGALPAALSAYALYGVVTGAYPSAYILPHKMPFAIFSSMSAAAISLFEFIRR